MAIQQGKANMEPIKMDEVLDKIGSFGRYQIRLLMIFGFMKVFGDAFMAMITAFIAAEPPWTCVTNSSSCNITGNIGRGHKNYNLRCSLARSDWEFNTAEFTSIVSEWDLVCDRSSLKSLSKSVLFAGYLVGVLFGGMLSDKFGRRPMVYFPSVLCNVLALIASFVNAFWIFTLLRVLMGVCIGSSSLSMFVLLIEYVGVKHRALAGTCMWYFWTLAMMLLALWGYLFRDWRTLSIAGAVPGLLQIFFWRFIPESSRWFIVRGNASQATTNLSEVARFNRKEMPANPVAVSEEKQRVGDVRDLFRSFKMVHITLLSCLCWFVSALVYYGVAFGTGSLIGGNRYLVFFLVSIVEIPSHFFSVILMNKIGRKKSLLVGLMVASFASIGAALLQKDRSQTGFLVGRIIMAMTAKFFINLAYNVIYIYSAELFPTVIRNIGMGTSSAAARIGSMSAPFITGLIDIHVMLPYSIFAISAFIAGVLCLTLPETLNAPTKDTFDAQLPTEPETYGGQSSWTLDSHL